MVADAKTADPAISIPAELERSLLASRRLQDLEELGSTTHSADESEDSSEALTKVESFLEKYPGDPEGLAIQTRLIKAKEEAENRRRREQQLTELRSFEDRANTISRIDGLRELLERTRVIARQNTNDSELRQIAERVGRVISLTTEIQDLIREGRLEEAEPLCTRSIIEFPQNAAFENCRAEIELRRIEQAAAYLREIEHSLAAEPDFGKQEAILQEAIRRYSAESYYADELTLLHNKQALLDAKIARARDLESKDLYEDALKEWEGLRDLYPWYEGVGKQIERVRREWDLRTTAVRNNWIGRIHKALSAGDVDAASSVLEQASLELAGDPVINDLRAQITETREAQIRRGELAAQAGDALTEGRLAEGAELLTKAARIFKNDAGFRNWALDLMLRKARSSLESDWAGSELLLRSIGQIDPNFAVPAELRDGIQSRRREAEIIRLLDEVDRAASVGDLTAAKRLLEAGRTKFPDDARVDQRRKAIADQIRQQEIRQIREQAQQQTAYFRAQLISSRTKRQIAKLRSAYVANNLSESTDPEVRALAIDLLSEIDAKAQELQASAHTQNGHRLVWYASGLVVVLATGLAMAWLFHTPKAKPVEQSNVATVTPAVPQVRTSGKVETGSVETAAAGTLEVKTNVPGVDLFLNGQKYNTVTATTSRLSLPAKAYDVYATRDGYENSRLTHVDVTKGSRVVVNLRLTPKPVALKILSAPAGTRIKLDGRDLDEPSTGKSISRNIAPGTHTFEVSRQGFLSKRFIRAVQPGDELTLTNSDLDLSSAGPDLAARELANWNRVKASGSLADLQAFEQQYPNGPHFREANNAIQQLAAAEKNRSEQTAWESVDKSKKEDLRAFVGKYPNSTHTIAAQHMLADMISQEKAAAEQSTDDSAWRSVNTSDSGSLQTYLGQFPSGRHASQAQQALSNLNRKPRPSPDAANVLAVLQKYAAAWSAKDLDTILSLQPSLNRRSLKAELAPVRVWRMTITPLAAPEVNGDHVSVTCRRQVDQVFSNGAEKQAPASTVIFVLKRQGAGWVIEDVR
jgi:hypothetical protein